MMAPQLSILSITIPDNPAEALVGRRSGINKKVLWVLAGVVKKKCKTFKAGGCAQSFIQ